MNEKMPRTPFSTRLSGSAKETELRIRNIMSGPKKRPPLPFLILVFSICIFCGNLVSCHVAEADVPDSQPTLTHVSDRLPPLPDLSQPERWDPVELHSHIITSSSNFPYEYLTEAEAARLENIPAEELPREAVDLYPGPFRGDFWEDMLLPVAYDEASNVTVYFVFGNMPAGTYRDININLFGAPNLKPDGIVLRWGSRAEYFPHNWYINIKYSSNPPLLVGDLDGDGQPEAALSLACSDGTGLYAECLYLFDLDTMTCAVPDYLDIPLELTLSPDGSTVKLQSGSLSLEVDVTELGGRFDRRVNVGDQVCFRFVEGRIFCELGLDFSCDTLGYMARACFPVVCEDGVYKLGPAEILTDDVFAEWQELYERSAP